MGRYDKDFEEFEAQENLFAEFEAQESAENNKIVGEQLYPETFEGKYLQPIYDVAAPVMKGLSVLEKPLSTSMAIGKTIGRGLNEMAGTTDGGMKNILEPLVQEAKSGIFPAPENSISSGLRDVGIGTEPMMSGMLPDNIKAQLPKMSAMIESVAPVDIIDMAASGAYGKTLPGMAGAKLKDMKIGNQEIAKTALIRGSQKDVKFLGDLKTSGTLDSLADKAIKSPTIRKNLTNPEKMIEYLEGVTSKVTDPFTGFRNKTTIVPGKLDEVGNLLSKEISKTGGSFNVNNFKQNIGTSLMQESDKMGSGLSLDPRLLDLEIDKYVKNTGNNQRSFQDLVKIKRGAADRIFDMKKAGFSNVENPTFAELVAQKIWTESDDMIQKMAAGNNNFEIIKLNNEFSDFSKIRELYANKDIATRYLPSLLEDLLPAAGVGVATTLATGSPYAGLAMGGAYPMARSGIGGISREFPAMALNARIGQIQPALNAGRMVKPGAAAGVMAMTQFPRDTKTIIEMKDQFLTEIAKRTKTPDGEILFNEILEIMSTKPEQIKNIMPIILQQYPDLFEMDEYDRIDGVINDPILKQKAIGKIVQAKEYSAFDNATDMEMLLNQNKFFRS